MASSYSKVRNSSLSSDSGISVSYSGNTSPNLPNEDEKARRFRRSGDAISNSTTKNYNVAIDLFQQDRNLLGALTIFLDILGDLQKKEFYYIFENECKLGKLPPGSTPTRLSVMLWCLFLKGELESKRLNIDSHEKILNTVTYPKLKELISRFDWLRVSGQEIPISLEYFTCVEDVSLTNVRLFHPFGKKTTDPIEYSSHTLELNNIDIEVNGKKSCKPFQLHTLLSKWTLQKLTVVCSKNSTQIDVKIDAFKHTLEHLYISGANVFVGGGKTHIKFAAFDHIRNPSDIERILKSCDKLTSLELIMEKDCCNPTLFSKQTFLVLPNLSILKLENVKFLISKEINNKLKPLPNLMLTNYSFTLIKDLTAFFKVSDMLIVISTTPQTSCNNFFKSLTSNINKKAKTGAASPKSVIYSGVEEDGQRKYIETTSLNKTNEINEASFETSCIFCY